MKRTTKYVALDVHQATTVASVRKQSGRVIARSILPTQPRSARLGFVPLGGQAERQLLRDGDGRQLWNVGDLPIT